MEELKLRYDQIDDPKFRKDIDKQIEGCEEEIEEITAEMKKIHEEHTSQNNPSTSASSQRGWFNFDAFYRFKVQVTAVDEDKQGYILN